MDPITQTRSIAGCPSVAMAMIVNYHHTTHNVWFTDADDYHHAYQGRNYWIDDDYDSLDFPSFPGLNNYLSSLEAKYQQGTGLTGQDKAALVFACGVAATQVYTSSGSGTFGVSQAYAAYQKFNFTQSLLLGPNDTSLYTHMAQNIKDSLPVHLAIVNSTWTSGHNIVVDGYNTNQYFHLNFGWGGSSNAWYLLPSQIPYSLNVIEGAIVDIDPSLPVGICKAEKTDIQVYPNPVEDNINLFGTLSGLQFTIFSLEGKTISNTFCSSGQSFVIPVSNLSSGIYFLTITGPAGKTVKKVIKK
ncbi:MAG: C10 family peptidase [Bacteroidetes bacterium]|nr:C10 family peptidase [Bacteroidota bacterium]